MKEALYGAGTVLVIGLVIVFAIDRYIRTMESRLRTT